MAKNIFYYLKVGFKLSLVMYITTAIMFVPLIFFLYGSIISALGGANTLQLSPFYFLIFPVVWILNGYFINRFKNWIFK